ncbi:hypothetical protein BDQ17DRAFT_1088963 [Cyathus striatus]|nr:hypothetical protein BDQ17DRAFT_1088963 [Cyathus striatus]
MVDWHDPVNIMLQYLAVVKMVHFTFGAYTWEYLSGLYFEMQVYTGKRELRWTFLIYVGCRICTLGALVSAVVGFNLTKEYNCEAWMKIVFVLSYLGLGFASALLVLRTIAFWDRQLFVSVLAIATFFLNVGFVLYAMDQAHAKWDPISGACVAEQTKDNKTNAIITLVTDLVLLFLMLLGIWRKKIAGGLWKMIYRQGIVWIFAATLGEVPCVLLFCLNLNDPMNLLFQTPSLVTMSICATRMYRELAEYAKPVHNRRTISAIEIGLGPARHRL